MSEELGVPEFLVAYHLLSMCEKSIPEEILAGARREALEMADMTMLTPQEPQMTLATRWKAQLSVALTPDLAREILAFGCLS